MYVTVKVCVFDEAEQDGAPGAGVLVKAICRSHIPSPAFPILVYRDLRALKMFNMASAAFRCPLAHTSPLSYTHTRTLFFYAYRQENVRAHVKLKHTQKH